MDIDLTRAVVVCSGEAAGVEAKAVDVLIEELAFRTGIELSRLFAFPNHSVPVIVIGTIESLSKMPNPVRPSFVPYLKAEGYMLRTVCEESAQTVWIVGAEARGVLYGVGKLLRRLRWGEGSIRLKAPLDVITAPYSTIRGHQLGYRPKNNAFDAWDTAQFDRYIRELALFGANSIEILPPRTDDHPTGPLMKVEPLEMMVRLGEIIDSYGLDTWIWYPNMGEDYSDPETIRAELEERERIFRELPHIHALFVPGSDPGKLEPDPLFAWLEQVAKLLQRYHPKAKIWVSPQIMRYDSASWMEAFYRQVKAEPEWLGGIVFGPHVDVPLPELRTLIPGKYPIRRYEDITHNYQCQYPVADWDLPFALTLGRESCNPRPNAQKHIHNLLAPYAAGNIGYSEGINDDLNKFVWCDQDWDPETPVAETLGDYARWFIDSERAVSITEGLFDLEENWVGPLAENEKVEKTLQKWQRIEREAPARVHGNYRFQMHLLRAYYDVCIKRRLHYEAELEQAARDALRQASHAGSLAAAERAEAILAQAEEKPIARFYRERCEKLADELFRSIGYQLTVSRHFARSQGRGAFLDTIDAPLNDIRWLRTQLAIVREADDEEQRLALIDRALNRTNPGPGGFYDHLGSYRGFRRIDPGAGWRNDPGYLNSPRIAHAMHLLSIPEARQRELGGIPLAWIAHANALLDTPIVVRYETLDPAVPYIVKVVYIGETSGKTPRDCWVRLTANDGFVLDDEVAVKAGGVTVRECKVPVEAIRGGKLKLTFIRTRGFKRLNVAEVWLLPDKGDLHAG